MGLVASAVGGLVSSEGSEDVRVLRDCHQREGDGLPRPLLYKSPPENVERVQKQKKIHSAFESL
jgi:hypothetical protein